MVNQVQVGVNLAERGYFATEVVFINHMFRCVANLEYNVGAYQLPNQGAGTPHLISRRLNQYGYPTFLGRHRFLHGAWSGSIPTHGATVSSASYSGYVAVPLVEVGLSAAPPTSAYGNPVTQGSASGILRFKQDDSWTVPGVTSTTYFIEHMNGNPFTTSALTYTTGNTGISSITRYVTFVGFNTYNPSLAGTGTLSATGSNASYTSFDTNGETVQLWTEPAASVSQSRTYRVSWTGKASALTHGGGDVSGFNDVTNMVSSWTNNDETAYNYDYSTHNSLTGGPAIIALSWIDPAVPLQEVFIAYESDMTDYNNGYRVRSSFKNRWDNAAAFRVIFWGESRYDLDTYHWSQLNPITRPMAYAGEYGVLSGNGNIGQQTCHPYWYVTFANECNKDLWISLPACLSISTDPGTPLHPTPSANDGFIDNLADYFYTNLNKNIKLYIEYLNEVWATGTYTIDTYNETVNRANDRSLNSGGDSNAVLAHKYAGLRTKEIMQVFTNRFAGSMNRINRVICSNPNGKSNDVYLLSTYGTSAYLDSYSTTIYWGGTFDWSLCDTQAKVEASALSLMGTSWDTISGSNYNAASSYGLTFTLAEYGDALLYTGSTSAVISSILAAARGQSIADTRQQFTQNLYSFGNTRNVGLALMWDTMGKYSASYNIDIMETEAQDASPPPKKVMFDQIAPGYFPVRLMGPPKLIFRNGSYYLMAGNNIIVPRR